MSTRYSEIRVHPGGDEPPGVDGLRRSRAEGSDWSVGTAVKILRTTLAFLAAGPAIVLALPVLGVLVILNGVAAATRWLSHALEPEALDLGDVLEYDPVIGWRPRGGLDTWIRSMDGEPFHFTTDPSGWRSRHSIQESDVVVFGDSFAFGHAANDDFAFVGTHGELAVKGIGAPGFNMVQSLLAMQESAPRLVGKVVIWLIYPGNDLDDNLRPQILGRPVPFVRESDNGVGWEIVTEHVRPEAWRFGFGRPNYETFVELCRATAFSERVFSACEYLIQEATGVCRDAGAVQFIVMTAPDLSPVVERQIAAVLDRTEDRTGFDPSMPDKRIRAICNRSGIEFVPLSEHLGREDYLHDDVHWSRKGHRRVLQLIRTLRDGAARD